MWQLISFLRYFLSAKGPGSIHSPFVFELYTEDILSDKEFYPLSKLKDLRELLYNDSRKISKLRTGAGSRRFQRELITIGALAKISGCPPKYSRLLFRLVNRFRPANILELGTSLGLGTMHLAAANPAANVLTLEGNSDLTGIAAENFNKAGLHSIKIKEGLFDETLPKALSALPTLDFVFLDGNHRKEPSINYIRQMIPRFHNNSVLVMDDIHWSKGMEEAWAEVKKMPEVTVTIDIFRMGLVFFRKEQVPEHFILRF